MAGRGRRVRKAKIRFAENKNKIRAEVNRQQSYINQYWQFKGGDPKFAGWNEKSENHFFSGGPRDGTWTTGHGIKDKLTRKGNGRGYGGVDQKQFTYMSPDSAYNRITGENRHYAKSQVRARSKKEYAKIAGELKDKALLSALGKLDTAKDSWNQIQNKDFDVSTVRSSRNFGASQNVLAYTDPTNYVSDLEKVLRSNADAGYREPNVSKGGNTGYYQYLKRDQELAEKTPYTWGVSETLQDAETYSYYTNMASAREPIIKEKTGIYSKDFDDDSGRDNHLVGLGIASNMVHGKTNKEIVDAYNKKQKTSKDEVKELNKLKQKLDNALIVGRGGGENRSETYANKDKINKIKAEIKLKFPDIKVSGNAKQISQQLSLSVFSKSQTISNTQKKQHAMAMYIAEDRINTSDKHRGEAVGYVNQANKKVVDKAKSDSLRAAAQKKYDDMWADGGYALLSDTSNNNIMSMGQANFNPLPSNEKSLVTKVGILKQYESWDQRRKHIAPELDERKEDLNKYYNSNYLQDFTVSDKEASQSMFGIDTPTGHSLAYSSMSDIGFDQKNAKTAITSLNKILSKTDTDRQDYAESLSGIEKKLLTLKEKQELKRKANKAVEADIARQVEADVSGGHISVNTEFRDKITGTSEELYDVNTEIAEHNTLKSYYSKSISKTDADVSALKETLEEVIEVKKRNDYETITAFTEDGGQNINRSKPSTVGYNNSNRFRRSTSGKSQRTRGGRRNNLSGLVI